jgi:hypothetical protein
MKRLTFLVAGLTFLLCAWAFAAEQAATPRPAKAASTGTATANITKMRAPGTILEITDFTLIIERKVKDSVEKMAFVLEKPMKFKVGDKVRVSYVEADGRMVTGGGKRRPGRRRTSGKMNNREFSLILRGMKRYTLCAPLLL